MAQKNKKKGIKQDMNTMINEFEKAPASTHLAQDIEQDTVNYRDTGLKRER